jgi:hypothetical protein
METVLPANGCAPCAEAPAVAASSVAMAIIPRVASMLTSLHLRMILSENRFPLFGIMR